MWAYIQYFSSLVFKQTSADRWQVSGRQNENVSGLNSGISIEQRLCLWVEGEEYEVTFFSIWIFKYHSFNYIIPISQLIALNFIIHTLKQYKML